MGGVNESVLLARAYLSRVAEPDCVPLWGLVREVGPVAAAELIRSGAEPPDLTVFVQARRHRADPDADLAAAERHRVRLVVPESDEWPHFGLGCLEATGSARLVRWRRGERRHAESGELMPPLALWVRGTGGLASVGVRSVSIVGARASTEYGNQVAADLAYGLASREFAVVSGGAYGIDAAAHRGALAAGGMTVVVSAGGVEQAYPTAHEKLFARAAETGLVLSESPPGAAPQRARFLTRNRLIAALGTGTVLVESARRSGARNTATHAGNLGRPVLAVPGPVTSALSAGNHELLREGKARMATSVSDVVADLGSIGEQLAVDTAPPADASPPSHATTSGGQAGRAQRLREVLDALDDGARRVYDGLPARRPITVTDLVLTCGLPPPTVLAALPVLSLHGLVEDTGDGLRRRVPR